MSGQAVKVVGAALAALAAVAVAAAAVLLLLGGGGGDGAPVRVLPPEPGAGGAGAGGDGGAVSMAQISGAVMAPGVYPIGAGDRLLDLVAAAGGFAPSADASGINLSIRVRDEMRYHIPTAAEARASPGTVEGGGGQAVDREPAGGDGGGRVDLNAASAEELEGLPGIGPSLAGAIVAYREANGPFDGVDDLDAVPGIGPKTLENIRALVTALPGEAPLPAPLPGTQTEIRH